MIFIAYLAIAYLNWIIISSGIESGAEFFKFLYPETFDDFYAGDANRFDLDGRNKILNCIENAKFNMLAFGILFPIFGPIMCIKITTRFLKFCFSCFWKTIFATKADSNSTESHKPTTF